MRLLIDLSILRHPYCGLGQVAMNYGRWIAAHPDAFPSDTHVTLLVPRSFISQFSILNSQNRQPGHRVSILKARPIYRILPCLMPRFDIWHSIHQLSPFRPVFPSTRRILTIHDLNFLYEKHGRKQARYLRRLQRECDSAADICFISEYAKQDALKHLHLENKRLHVIYNGVESLTQGPQAAPPGIDPHQPFLLSIGVVKPKKNLHTLFPMMDQLEGYQLIIAGDNSSAYARQLQAQLPQHPNISMIGPVDDNQRRWLYAHCSGLLFPSLAEGFGLPVIEAMQWGKPVFCSRMTSLPEIGGNAAFYFPDFNPNTMASTVKERLSQFSNHNAQECIQHAAFFTYDRHMQSYLKLY